MAYKALYRKYRPATFEEVVGQQHIVMTLQNAIKNNKLAHAYLFCGPRGTGKTTIAKLLAKTINCESTEHRPCGKCASCIDIQESTHPDVVELDAATNNGVEEIRDLIERVKYAPLRGKYKVYIIDEVHMMTASAFNALLKTLEEPPEYCIFILATTEPQKVLPTIISRCQRFDFTKVPVPLIAQRLKVVAADEKITIDDKAVELIAEIADGGMRDALSIMDQCIAYAQDNIQLSDVNAVYGITTTSAKIEIMNCIKEKDMEKLVGMINNIAEKGVDIPRLTMDLLNLAKEAVIYSYAQNPDLLSRLSPQQAQQLIDDFSTNRLLRYIDYLMEASGKYRGATDSLSYLEVCLLKMMADEEPSAPAKPVAEKKAQPKEQAEPVVKKEIKKETPKPVETTYKHLSDEEVYQILCRSSKTIKENNAGLWEQLANSTDPTTAVLRVASVLAESQNELIVTVDTRMQANAINETKMMAHLEEVAKNIYHTEKKLLAVSREEASYLITYFKQRQSNEPQPEPEKKKEPEVTPENNGMTDLFGNNGFETRKD